MKKYFVDASFLIALLKSDDPNHKLSKKVSEKIDPRSKLYVNFVCLSEAITVLSMRVGKKQANLLLDKYENRELLEIDINETVKQKAINIFENSSSKNLSFFDCIHFATMESANIKAVLGFDKHFKNYGFKLINN